MHVSPLTWDNLRCGTMPVRWTVDALRHLGLDLSHPDCLLGRIVGDGDIRACHRSTLGAGRLLWHMSRMQIGMPRYTTGVVEWLRVGARRGTSRQHLAVGVCEREGWVNAAGASLSMPSSHGASSISRESPKPTLADPLSTSSTSTNSPPGLSEWKSTGQAFGRAVICNWPLRDLTICH